MDILAKKAVAALIAASMGRQKACHPKSNSLAAEVNSSILPAGLAAPLFANSQIGYTPAGERRDMVGLKS